MRWSCAEASSRLTIARTNSGAGQHVSSARIGPACTTAPASPAVPRPRTRRAGPHLQRLHRANLDELLRIRCKLSTACCSALFTATDASAAAGRLPRSPRRRPRRSCSSSQRPHELRRDQLDLLAQTPCSSRPSGALSHRPPSPRHRAPDRQRTCDLGSCQPLALHLACLGSTQCT